MVTPSGVSLVPSLLTRRAPLSIAAAAIESGKETGYEATSGVNLLLQRMGRIFRPVVFSAVVLTVGFILLEETMNTRHYWYQSKFCRKFTYWYTPLTRIAS